MGEDNFQEIFFQALTEAGSSIRNTAHTTRSCPVDEHKIIRDFSFVNASGNDWNTALETAIGMFNYKNRKTDYTQIADVLLAIATLGPNDAIQTRAAAAWGSLHVHRLLDPEVEPDADAFVRLTDANNYLPAHWPLRRQAAQIWNFLYSTVDDTNFLGSENPTWN